MSRNQIAQENYSALVHGLSKQQLEAMAIQHCPVLEWGGIMLEALAIQHCPMSEWGGFMLEAIAIQHCPVSEWDGIMLISPVCGV